MCKMPVNVAISDLGTIFLKSAGGAMGLKQGGDRGI